MEPDRQVLQFFDSEDETQLLSSLKDDTCAPAPIRRNRKAARPLGLQLQVHQISSTETNTPGPGLRHRMDGKQIR